MAAIRCKFELVVFSWPCPLKKDGERWAGCGFSREATSMHIVGLCCHMHACVWSLLGVGPRSRLATFGSLNGRHAGTQSTPTAASTLSSPSALVFIMPLPTRQAPKGKKKKSKEELEAGEWKPHPWSQAVVSTSRRQGAALLGGPHVPARALMCSVCVVNTPWVLRRTQAEGGGGGAGAAE